MQDRTAIIEGGVFRLQDAVGIAGVVFRQRALQQRLRRHILDAEVSHEGRGAVGLERHGGDNIVIALHRYIRAFRQPRRGLLDTGQADHVRDHPVSGRAGSRAGQKAEAVHESKKGELVANRHMLAHEFFSVLSVGEVDLFHETTAQVKFAS